MADDPLTPRASRSAERLFRRGATPDAGDVPQARVARDPGVQAQPADFGAQTGVAGANVGAMAGELARTFGEAATRIQNRKETIELANRETKLNEETAEDIRKTSVEQDFSDPAVLAELGRRLEERGKKLQSTWPGSPAGADRLATMIAGRSGYYRGQAAVMSHDTSTNKVAHLFGGKVNEIYAEVARDPTKFQEAAGKIRQAMEAYSGNFTPAQEQKLSRVAMEGAATTALNTLLFRGDIKGAKAMLELPEVRESLGANAQTEITKGIESAERELTKPQREVQVARALVKALLPNASPEEQEAVVARHMLKGGPGKVLSKEEAAAAGFPSGTVVQMKADGNYDVLVKAPEPGATILTAEQVKAAGLPEGAVIQKKSDGTFGQLGWTPEAAARQRGLEKEAEWEVRRKNVRKILEDVGALPSPGGGAPGGDAPGGVGAKAPAAAPASGGQSEPVAQTTQPMDKVMKLYRASQALAFGGETELANSLLAQVRFLAEHDPSVRKDKRLGEPLTREDASSLGVPLGTTWGEVLGVTPRSPEKEAEAKALATVRAQKRVSGEEQLAFIDEALVMIDGLMAEASSDPGILGIRGSLRATGRTATQVISDLGFNALIDKAREIAASQTDATLDQVNGWFASPTLSALRLIENSVGLILARVRVPDGRLPVDIIQKSIDDVKLGGLEGSQQVLDRLTLIRRVLVGREQGIRQRFGIEAREPVYRLNNKTRELERVR